VGGGVTVPELEILQIDIMETSGECSSKDKERPRNGGKGEEYEEDLCYNKN